MDIRPRWYAPFLGALVFVGFTAVAQAQPPDGPSFQPAFPGFSQAHMLPATHSAPSTQATRKGDVDVVQDDDTAPPFDDKAKGHEKAERAKNAGVIEGQVVSVDYQSGMIGLLTAGRGRVDVMVLPSTNIQGRGDSFHTIADISRGSRLRIFLSQRAGQFFAQIIHLR